MPDNVTIEENTKYPRKPNNALLEKAQQVMQEDFTESKKIIDYKSKDWDRWESMFKSEQQTKKYDWESNLIIPKADYIIETITPQIINTIFSLAQWLTIKNPLMDEHDLRLLEKFFLWVMDRKVGFYLPAIELFKSAPITGTSICKLSLKNGWPTVDFVPLKNFFPDPHCNKPGDIESMAFCMEKFRRRLSQLERFTTPNGDPVYFNLDIVREKEQSEASVEMEGTDVTVTLPKIYNILERWGEFETTSGNYDVNKTIYKPGRYEEYIITAILEGESNIGTIIRCEPSTFKYRDRQANKDVYLKPYVACLYSIYPGEFYGKGALQPVESLINELIEHHNLYLDEHKRSVMSILQVLERSNLTEEDLQMKPYAIWYVSSHDDVQRVQFPEMNLQAYNVVNAILNKELERGVGIADPAMGIPTSKRQTYGEIRSLLLESTRRFATFIQMADRLTLRPIARRIMLILKQTILKETQFILPDMEITIKPEQLDAIDLHDFQFAATGIEPEFSKYNRQNLLPRLLKAFADLAMASGGEYKLNLPGIMQMIADTYDIQAQDFVTEAIPMVPVDPLIQAAPEDLKPVLMELIAGVLTQMKIQQQKAK